MITLILIRGIPGSGKSTIAKMLGIPHVEADQYFMRDGVYKFDPSKLPDAHKYAQERTAKLLNDGHSVVVSNTFSREWEMRPYIDIADRAGASVNIITAHGKFRNIHGVPDEVIEKMKARWEEVK